MDEDYMRLALEQASAAAGADEVPVGAVIVREGLIMGQGYNRNIGDRDPSAHAEIVALREACAYSDNYRLSGATIYVTLEPCLMCFTALIHARIQRLVYGATDHKSGYNVFLDSADLEKYNHTMEIVPGILENACVNVIQDFFRNKRERGKRKWMRHKKDL